MKVIILAGGKGTRFGELTKKIPKPMIKIHGRPMLIHIISIYASQNFNKFYIATGHRSKIIVDYFKQFQTYKNFYKISGIQKELEINFINTGVNSMTGGRLKRLQKYFKKNENFMLTYGDGLSNVNLKKLKIFHYKKKKLQQSRQ